MGTLGRLTAEYLNHAGRWRMLGRYDMAKRQIRYAQALRVESTFGATDDFLWKLHWTFERQDVKYCEQVDSYNAQFGD